MSGPILLWDIFSLTSNPCNYTKVLSIQQILKWFKNRKFKSGIWLNWEKQDRLIMVLKGVFAKSHRVVNNKHQLSYDKNSQGG